MNNTESRLKRLEETVGVIQSKRLVESFSSSSELKQFLVKEAEKPPSYLVTVAGANPQGLSGETMLKDCSFAKNDFHWVAEETFFKLEEELEDFKYSGFIIEFEPRLLSGGEPHTGILNLDIYDSYDGEVFFTRASIKVKQVKNKTYEGEYPFNWGFFYLTEVNGKPWTGKI